MVLAKIRVRKIREDDSPAVFRLFIEGYTEDPSFYKFPAIQNEEDFKKFFGQTIDKVRDGFLIAEVDGKVLGFILSFPSKIFNPDKEDVGQIQWIVVDEKYRRKGVGSRLMKESLKHLASRGIRIVVASTWQQNVASIDLFRKFGFEKDAKPEEIVFKIAVNELQAKSSTAIVIRKAMDKDVKRIAEIEGGTEEMFYRSYYRFIVAEINGEIAGFIDPIIEQCMGGRVGKILCLNVDPKHRRIGVGTALVKAAFEHFTTEGIDCVYSFTISDNIPALDFWRKIGFEEDRRSFTMRKAII